MPSLGPAIAMSMLSYAMRTIAGARFAVVDCPVSRSIAYAGLPTPHRAGERPTDSPDRVPSYRNTLLLQ